MHVPRRLGVSLAAALVAAGSTAAGATAAARHHTPAHHAAPHRGDDHRGGGTLPVDAIQQALQAEGSVSDGVLQVSLDRDDISNVTLNGTPIKPSFQINGELDFQPLGNHQALFNGDLALKASEINPVIDAITRNGLTFQAEHQHLYDFSPMVWFIHLRGQGDPVRLAQAVHNVVKATSTPLPQTSPSNPTTPLDQDRLQRILHGYDAEVGSDGVVTVYVRRRNPEFINRVLVQPQTNIATNIAFEPLNADGSSSAAIPDFSMTANEINPVIATMRGQGWDIGCLYNQETAEFPQLYFSHTFKTGDPYALAAEIRKGLDRMNVQ